MTDGVVVVPEPDNHLKAVSEGMLRELIALHCFHDDALLLLRDAVPALVSGVSTTHIAAASVHDVDMDEPPAASTPPAASCHAAEGSHLPPPSPHIWHTATPPADDGAPGPHQHRAPPGPESPDEQAARFCRLLRSCDWRVKQDVRRSWVLCPPRNHQRLVNLCSWFLMGVGANCDIQPILDQTALVNYILKYAMKTEKKSLAFIDAFKEILKGAQHNAELDVHKVCLKALNHGVADRDYTAQEVSHVLLGLPLVHMSRAHVPLSFSGSVEVLADDGEPTRAKRPSFVDWYTDRPDEPLRDMCAYELAACYAFTKNDPYLLRKRMVFPVVKPFLPFQPGDPMSASNLKFYKQTLMLYRPWRLESHLLHGMPPPTPPPASPASPPELAAPPDDDPVWHTAYHAWLPDAHKMLQRHHSAALRRHEASAREAVARHDAKVAREEAGLPSSSDEEPSSDDGDEALDDDMQLFRTRPRWAPPYEPDAEFAQHARLLANITLDDLGGRYQERHAELAQWLNVTQANNPDPAWNPDSVRDVHLSKLRGEQLLAVRIVDQEVLAHLNRAPDASTAAPTPLYLTLKGAGGCGKSHVIKAITKLANLICPGCLTPGEEQRVALTGPTGPAAFAIGGGTVHSLLSLPRKKAYSPLSPARLKELQRRLKSLCFLILDEHSMVGLKTIGCISLRLKEIKQSELPFGGVSVLIVGDEAQLPPVMDLPKFQAITMTNDSAIIHGHTVYALFVYVVILERAFRQVSTDSMYAMLTRLRDNVHDRRDWELICARDFDNLSPEAQAPFQSAVRSFLPFTAPLTVYVRPLRCLRSRCHCSLLRCGFARSCTFAPSESPRTLLTVNAFSPLAMPSFLSKPRA
jgi:ATP-dependent DNA helicase PIF1